MNLLELLFSDLGMTFETGLTLIFFIGGLIFYASDFKLGVALHLVANGVLFIVFYLTGANYVMPLTMFFISLVVLSLTLYSVQKQAKIGGFV